MYGELSLEHLEAQLSEMKAALVRIEAKMDAKDDKMDERLRSLETKMAQVWILGALGVLVFAPVISFIIRKVGL